MLLAEKASMSSLRSPGLKCLLLAASLGLAGTANAACNGPQELVARMHAKPSVQNSAALGSWYASRQQFGCAIEVFQAGLKSNGQSAQLRYLLGISLAAAKRPNEAVAELGKSAAIE